MSIACIGLGTTELQGTSHEVFTAEFCDGSACFVDAAHGHKGKTFRALRTAIDHDLGVADAADAIEEFKKVALRGVVGKVSNIEALGGDFSRIRRRDFTTRARLALWTRGGICGRTILWLGAVLRFGFTKKAKGDDSQELLHAGRRCLTVGAGAVWAWTAMAVAVAIATALRLVRHGCCFRRCVLRVRAGRGTEMAVDGNGRAASSSIP